MTKSKENVTAAAANQAVILFDGVCNLCNGFVQFVIRYDRREHFRLAALQSAAGRRALHHIHAANYRLDSVVLIENGKIYLRSTAALKILRRLGGLWPLAYAAILLPAFLRDAIYVVVAKNRYRWFGRQESCLVPTPALQRRFLAENAEV